MSSLLGGKGLIFVTDRIFANFEELWGLKKQEHHFVCPLSCKLIPSGWVERFTEDCFELLLKASTIGRIATLRLFADDLNRRQTKRMDGFKSAQRFSRCTDGGAGYGDSE